MYGGAVYYVVAGYIILAVTFFVSSCTACLVLRASMRSDDAGLEYAYYGHLGRFEAVPTDTTCFDHLCGKLDLLGWVYLLYEG
jgi:hypothetical protein